MVIAFQFFHIYSLPVTVGRGAHMCYRHTVIKGSKIACLIISLKIQGHTSWVGL